MWYNAGTITVSNGSQFVDGQGTQFVGPVQASYGLLAPDGRLYEILQVISATRLQLVRPYAGGTVANVPYDVVPMTIDLSDLIARAQALVDRYQAFLSGVGQGVFPDGSAAAPAIRFASDQDTGIRHVAQNIIAITTGGQDILTAGTYVGIGTGNPLHKLHVNNSSTDPTFALVGNNTNGLGMGIRGDGFPAILSYLGTGLAFGGGLGGALSEYGRFNGDGNFGVGTTTPRAKIESYRNVAGVSNVILSSSFAPASYIELNAGVNGVSNGGFDIRLGGLSRAVIDDAGNFLVGVTSASNHVIARGTVEGDLIMQVQGKAHPGVAFFSAASGAANGAACAFALNKNSATGRSANAAGTINAAGADSAEYMVKAEGCGIIAKGDVCGVDRDGRLTKSWAGAISFVVKSTDPHLVGGDTWAKTPPPERADDESEEDFGARVAAWNIIHEAEREVVDRIAFCGQVPCNVSENFEVGDYIIAAQDGDGIKAVAVKPDAITLSQYMSRIGKVWAIRDGRAWIDVQHG